MKIMVTIPLVKYLNGYIKNWGEVYVNKTLGGQIWLSADAPADYIGTEIDEKNYIEFNDSSMYERLPKEIWKCIDIEKCKSKNLKDVIKELKKQEE